jgi:hypothetical protein
METRRVGLSALVAARCIISISEMPYIRLASRVTPTVYHKRDLVAINALHSGWVSFSLADWRRDLFGCHHCDYLKSML